MLSSQQRAAVSALSQGFLRSADGRERQRSPNCFSSKVSKVSGSWGCCQAEQKDFTDFLFFFFLAKQVWVILYSAPFPNFFQTQGAEQEWKAGPQASVSEGSPWPLAVMKQVTARVLPFQGLLWQHRSTALQGLPVPKRVLSWKSHHQSHQLSRQKELMLLVRAY